MSVTVPEKCSKHGSTPGALRERGTHDVELLRCGHSTGLPAAAVQIVRTPDRAAVGMILAGLDKAIDLIDEAASKLRTEIDSMPIELDEVERRIMQLEIEREALRKEKDEVSLTRLERLDRELAERKEARTRLKVQWQEEKASIQSRGDLAEELEQVRLAMERAQRHGDYAKASELQYGRLPELARR